MAKRPPNTSRSHNSYMCNIDMAPRLKNTRVFMRFFWGPIVKREHDSDLWGGRDKTPERTG